LEPVKKTLENNKIFDIKYLMENADTEHLNKILHVTTFYEFQNKKSDPNNTGKKDFVVNPKNIPKY
jgi:hypothetical protein